MDVVEDSLKTIRILHRLIMSISLATIVFSLSLSLPVDKVRQLEIIDALLAADFSAYEKFAAEKIEAEKIEFLAPIEKEMRDALENESLLVFNLEKISEKFGEPFHIGKIIVADLVLDDISSATLVRLDALNALSLDQDLQIVVPHTAELVEEINRFFDTHMSVASSSITGKRVDTIRVGLTEFDFSGDSFLPDDEVLAGLYFELLDPVFSGGAPVFNANFLADVKEVPESSFLDWIKTEGTLDGLVEINEGQVKFAPSLKDLPNGFREQSLGLLSAQLKKEIADRGPENQSVSILGTDVPGVLIVIAAPLVLTALSYYFMSHTGHLKRLEGKDDGVFQTFAWLPLAHQAKIRIPIGRSTRMHLELWQLESLVGLMFLPILALLILYTKLAAFGGIGLGASLFMMLSAAIIVVFGSLSMNNIQLIRGFRS